MSIEWVILTAKSAGWTFLITVPWVFGVLAVEYVWNRGTGFSRHSVWFNFRSWIISDFTRAFLSPIAFLLPGILAAHWNLGLIDLRLGNPQSLAGMIFAFVVWVFVTDFFFYWWHRLQHVNMFLWATHRLHHSDEEVNASTTRRYHWVQDFFEPFIATVPVALLFASIAHDLTYSYMFFAVWGPLVHAKLPINFGPLLVSPTYHRIHHSSLSQHNNKNLAQFFPFWDILFGTYYRPRIGEVYPTGLYDGERDITVIGAHVVPFKIWTRQAKEALAKARRWIPATTRGVS